MDNLATMLAESAWAEGNRVAIRQDEIILTYAELNDTSARVASLLQAKGVRAGDRVALVMPNVTYFPIAYYGILRAGAVVVPMNPLLKAREIAFTLRDSGSRIVLAFPLCADAVAKAAAEVGVDCLVTNPMTFDTLVRATEPMPEAVDRAENDTAVILYTSGTTGTPKGAELTHRNLMTNAASAAETLLHIGPSDVLFGGLPLFHAFGQTCALNAAVAAAATLTMLPRFGKPRRWRSCTGTGSPSSWASPRCSLPCSTPGSPTATTSRGCIWPSPVELPCRSRCCTPSSGNSASPFWRDTDSRRRHRSPRSTPGPTTQGRFNRRPHPRSRTQTRCGRRHHDEPGRSR